jgi:hypothetical protein
MTILSTTSAINELRRLAGVAVPTMNAYVPAFLDCFTQRDSGWRFEGHF